MKKVSIIAVIAAIFCLIGCADKKHVYSVIPGELLLPSVLTDVSATEVGKYYYLFDSFDNLIEVNGNYYIPLSEVRKIEQLDPENNQGTFGVMGRYMYHFKFGIPLDTLRKFRSVNKTMAEIRK